MSVLSLETKLMQNSALGAALLWKFVSSYCKHGDTHDDPPLPLVFLVLPIALHKNTAELASKTQRVSGLRKFAGKFSSSELRMNDELVAFHNRCIRMRKLTTDALSMSLRCRLLAIEISTATIRTHMPFDESRLPEGIGTMFKAVDRLGAWCACLELHEIAAIMKVAF